MKNNYPRLFCLLLFIIGGKLINAQDAGVSKLLSPINLSCGSSGGIIKALVNNYGSTSISSIPVVVKITGSATTTILDTLKKTITAGNRDTLTFKTTINTFSGGTYTFKVYTNLSGDNKHTNDTLISKITVLGFPNTPKVTNASSCGPSTLTLKAVSTTPSSKTYWFLNDSSPKIIESGDSITRLISTTTSYYAASLQGSGFDADTTTFSANNGQTGNMFDVTVNKTVTVDSFEVSPNSAGSDTVLVYYKLGTYVGSSGSASGWTFAGKAGINSTKSGYGTMARARIGGFTLQAGNIYGFYVSLQSSNILNYTNGISSPFDSFKNATMKISGGIGVAGSFGSTFTPRDWNGVIYYSTPNCASPRAKVTATILQTPSGAKFFKSVPFQGQFNTGDFYDPDNLCLDDTNTYQLTPPKGFSNSDFGTKWIVSNISFGTPNGTTTKDTSLSLPTSTKNGVFRFFPKKYADSIFVLRFHIKIVTSGCDSAFERYVHVRFNPVANFGFKNACLGYAVVFSDSSTIKVSNVSSWSWDFGDGSAKSITRNPTHIYPKSGSYTTSLFTSSAEGCFATISKTVITYPQPLTKFTEIITCNGFPIKFADASTISTGSSITNWKWHFGDNTDGFTQNPSHIYNKSGPYNVKLIITSSNGCKDSTSVNIRVPSVPVANFTLLNACVGSQIYFSNTSIDSTNKSTYHWDFGDGTTSTLAVPAHIYNANGTYKPSLVVTSKDGCSDTITKLVTPLSKPIPNFIPPNACIGQSINFADSSHSDKGSLYAWDFGDGTNVTVSSISTKHVYKKTGIFKVLLAITNGSGCSDTQSHNVTIINFPKAGFTSNTVCLNKATIFTNTSTGTGLTYLWDFGDGSANSKIQSPTRTYGTSGTFAAKLKSINQYGCTDSFSTNVIVNPVPDIQLWAYHKHGYQVTFIPQDSTIGNFVWHFGTTTNDSSSKKSPTFTYPSVDATYTVKLVVTNSSGCVSILMDNLSVTKSGIESIPNTFKYVTVYPNPFAGKTTISYKLLTQSKVNIGIYDAQGKIIAQLRDGNYPAGDYSDAFDAKKYQATEGIYFLKMNINDEYYTTKIMNLK